MKDFLEKLHPLIESLGEIGEFDCGNLSRAQAALFHNATQMLVDLEEDLNDSV